MPSQVLTKRRVKRRQQRLRLVSKNAKRKVRSVRKHRKTAKKVMRGGGLFDKPVPIKSEIYLEGQQNTPCITITTTKNENILRSNFNFTIEIVVNTELVKGDVRKLLEKIFTSGGDSITRAANSKYPPRLDFLYGLADSPERDGAIDWAEADTRTKKGSLTDADKRKIAEHLNSNPNCVIKIKTEKLKSGNLKLIVEKYSRVYPNKVGTTKIKTGKQYCNSWGNEFDDYACVDWRDVMEDAPLYVPILKFTDPNPKPEGITFIYWVDANNPDVGYKAGVRTRVPNNENTLTIDTTDIENFIQNLNKPKLLKTDGTLVDAPVLTSPSSDTSTVDVAEAPVDVVTPTNEHQRPVTDLTATPLTDNV